MRCWLQFSCLGNTNYFSTHGEFNFAYICWCWCQSSGDMWRTWSRTFLFAFCGLHSFRKTHNSQHIAAKCISAGILVGSPYHLHSKSWVAFIFGMSLHVYIIMCPIMNELFKVVFWLSMLLQKFKDTNINNHESRGSFVKCQTITWKEPVFSSPEHKVLRVSYCDRSLSVVRRRASSVVRRP